MIYGLLELHTTADPALRRATWRASMASLAQACASDVLGPLDGIATPQLYESVGVALREGLVDELAFLSRAAAASALYELSTVLPRGDDRRALERRVSEMLREGEVATVVAVAMRISLGSGPGLTGGPGGLFGHGGSQAMSFEALRARISLAAGVPPSLGLRVDRLAVSLLSRRESSRVWVDEPSRGSLPDRRMAARLIEQAAWGMARQAALGEDWPVRLMKGEAFCVTLPRLLADREPLVFKHVARARGLLARFYEPFQAAIDAGLHPSLSPTEWRRAGVSLTASAAFSPGPAFDKLAQLLDDQLLERDPGLAASLCWGAVAAAEAEPALAGEMLSMIVDAAPMETAEALVDLGGASLLFAREALGRAVALLSREGAQAAHETPDDGREALRSALLDELRGEVARPIAVALEHARAAFMDVSASAACHVARDVLDQADAGVATLELLDAAEDDDSEESAEVRRRAFVVLRDVCHGVLSDGGLDDLLSLGHAPHQLAELAALRDRVAAWVLDREVQRRSTGGVMGALLHQSVRVSQLRTLIYVADARTMVDVPQSQSGGRARRQRIAALMLRRLADRSHPQLCRPTCAALARAVDALIRTGDLDPSDVCLMVAQVALSAEEIEIIAEASANPNVSALLRSFLPVLCSDGSVRVGGVMSLPPTRRVPGASLGEGDPLADVGSLPPLHHCGRAGEQIRLVFDVARLIEADSSGRTEALRGALLRLSKGLASILSAGALSDLYARDGGDGPLAQVDAALAALLSLSTTAEQRMGLRPVALAVQVRSLSSALMAAFSQGRADAASLSIAATQDDIERLLPPMIAQLTAPVLSLLKTLPMGRLPRQAGPASREGALPPWIPPHRTLGGYFVVSPIGAGSAGSVFIVRRVADRSEPGAERFALKVPEYEGSSARALSEAQFLQLFREEASALLSLPHHPNLARFVTFDLAARPKPILVMELVEGLALEAVIEGRAIKRIGHAFSLLDGVLAGLEAMHAVGVGHLDVKPQNVILRGEREPVLVDFGLAGRHIRPGCGTLSYGAPEIWATSKVSTPSPMPADVYAVCCLAYELLTGMTLFDPSSEVAAVTAHLGHDGSPAPIEHLAAIPSLTPLARALSRGLRRRPEDRVSVAQLRAELSALARPLSDAAWPLPFPQRAPRSTVIG